MHPRFHASPYIHPNQDDDWEADTGPESPSSCEETKITRPSSKKRRNMTKRVVTVPIGEEDGSRSRGEGYPPSDSWAWRKYGQKPIKGSPYPRGYYRCSSAKGCPARKQVERSCADPRTLTITYTCDHNHPLPTKPHHQADSLRRQPKKSEDSGGASVSTHQSTSSQELPLADSPPLLTEPDDFVWFDDFPAPRCIPVFASPMCTECDWDDTDVLPARIFSMREEDESLFGDLGDLPDCSSIFRWRTVEAEGKSRRRGLGPVPCGDTSR